MALLDGVSICVLVVHSPPHPLPYTQPDWVIEGGSVRFAAGDRAHAPVEALTLLANTMHYATELERIV